MTWVGRALNMALILLLLVSCAPPPAEPLGDPTQMCAWWGWFKVGLYSLMVLAGAISITVAASIRMGAAFVPAGWVARGNQAIGEVLVAGIIAVGLLGAFWWAAGYFLGSAYDCSAGGAAGALLLRSALGGA